MTDRRPLIAGNWKMNLTLDESTRLIGTVVEGIRELRGVEIMVAPPFTSLCAVRKAIGKADILLGGQNMHWEVQGAYTGEISGRMLKEAGCSYVILGHSERRTYFGESDEMVDRKIEAALSVGLAPILCIGERLEQREAGQTFPVIEQQLTGSLKGPLKKRQMPGSVVLAYEPVWAIGTGRTANPAQAQEVHDFIRRWIERNFDPGAASKVRILYGGSVNPKNAHDLLSRPDIDGALVGGASLKGDSFVKIARSAA